MRVFQEQERSRFSLVCAVVVLLGWIEVRTGAVSHAAEGLVSHVALAEDVNDLNWDLANEFDFVWDSVALSLKISNPQDGVGADSNVPVLTLSGRVDILHTSNLATIDVDSAGVWEVLDTSGHALEWQSTKTDYQRAYQEYGWYWNQTGVHTPQQWSPFTVTIQLSADPNSSLPSSISAIGGYIYALYADEVINVDVPFDPNYGCLETEAAPNLVFCVDPATPPLPEPIEYVSSSSSSSSSEQRVIGSSGRPKNAIALYKYTTWVKSDTGSSILGVHGLRYPSSLYAFGDYAVIRTGLFDSARNIAASFPTQWILGDTAFGTGAKCSGKTEQVYGDDYDMIRHVIAVHPVEVKIPFVLRNIPVPSFQATGK